jgi:hypothetical protein
MPMTQYSSISFWTMQIDRETKISFQDLDKLGMFRIDMHSENSTAIPSTFAKVWKSVSPSTNPPSHLPCLVSRDTARMIWDASRLIAISNGLPDLALKR